MKQSNHPHNHQNKNTAQYSLCTRAKHIVQDTEFSCLMLFLSLANFMRLIYKCIKIIQILNKSHNEQNVELPLR